MSTNPGNFRPRSAAGGQSYMDSAIRTASPAKLRLMLLDRSVEVAQKLSNQWRAGEQMGPNEHSLSLLELLGELLSGIAGSEDPEEAKLCHQVSDLYVFLTKHLVIAEDHSDADAVDEIRLVLEAEAETWRSVCAQEMTRGAGHTTNPVSSGDAPATTGLNFSA